MMMPLLSPAPPASTTTHAPAAVSVSVVGAATRESLGSTLQPVSQAAETAKQQLTLRQGVMHSPLSNASKVSAYLPDVAAGLVTYGANGKLHSGGRPDHSHANHAHTSPLQSEEGIHSDEASGGAPLASDDSGGEKSKQVEQQERQEVSQLAARDREVRAHEQAHAAVGGSYAGAPSYQFQRGPDGVNYAVAGEVSIDTGPAATPEETIRKAEVVKRAALAPAEPSAQDRKVAQEASQLMANARAELAINNAAEADAADGSEGNTLSTSDREADQSPDALASTSTQSPVIQGSHKVDEVQSSMNRIDVRA